MKEEFVSLDYSERSPEDMLTASRSYLDSIRRRRTVRDFSDRVVDKQIIENAILAAGSAPSGANMQPWHFVAIGDAACKQRIREAAEVEEREFYQRRASEEWLASLAPLGTDEKKPFLETAPWLIVVFLKKFTDVDGDRRKNYYTSESVGIATGLLISALHLSGLATLTHTPSPMKFLNGICERPQDERPFLILVTGYPSADARVPNLSRRSLDEIATFV